MELCRVQVWKVGRFMVGRLDWGGEDGEARRTIPKISLRAKETYRKVCAAQRTAVYFATDVVRILCS